MPLECFSDAVFITITFREVICNHCLFPCLKQGWWNVTIASMVESNRDHQGYLEIGICQKPSGGLFIELITQHHGLNTRRHVPHPSWLDKRRDQPVPSPRNRERSGEQRHGATLEWRGWAGRLRVSHEWRRRTRR